MTCSDDLLRRSVSETCLGDLFQRHRLVHRPAAAPARRIGLCTLIARRSIDNIDS